MILHESLPYPVLFERWDEASSLPGTLTELKAQDAARAALAVGLVCTGRMEAGRELLEAIRTPDYRQVVLVALWRQSISEGRPAEARAYAEGLPEGMTYPTQLSVLAAEAARRGHHQEALNLASCLRLGDPARANAYAELARIAVAQGQRAEAHTLLQQATAAAKAIGPMNAAPRNELAAYAWAPVARAMAAMEDRAGLVTLICRLISDTATEDEVLLLASSLAGCGALTPQVVPDTIALVRTLLEQLQHLPTPGEQITS